MITYNVTNENETIKEITVIGHANYKPKGEDIICAAASMATFMTANAIKYLKLEHLIQLEINDGYFKIKQITHDEIVNGLLKNLDYTMRDLIRQYPSYILKN